MEGLEGETFFEHLHNTFSDMDVNSSGGLDKKELQEALAAKQVIISDDDMDEMMAQADLNKNGNCLFSLFPGGPKRP